MLFEKAKLTLGDRIVINRMKKTPLNMSSYEILEEAEECRGKFTFGYFSEKEGILPFYSVRKFMKIN